MGVNDVKASSLESRETEMRLKGSPRRVQWFTSWKNTVMDGDKVDSRVEATAKKVTKV